MWTKMILALVLGLALSLAAYPAAIPLLYKLKFGQSIRQEGPQSHLKKAGTPVMGGIVFILTTIIASLIVSPKAVFNYDYLVVTMAFVGYGLIGLIDDLIVVVKKDNEGLKPKYKFLLQSILAVVFYLMYRKVTDSTIIIPFFNWQWDLGWFFVIFVFLMFTGTSNAVNLTDGLDGLCGGLMVFALIPYVYFCYRIGKMNLVYLQLALIGSLLGYLCYNHYPARIFMGDTSSLALGGILAALAMVTKEEVALILIGGVFVIETLSVIIQVGYFKLTHGKRFFRMAPIHHHFELGGMKETRIVWMFYVVGAALSLCGLLIGVLS
ncbi:MAG: phospho-N-acetylmuramoyl-pentapeptide-transferase [Erysipelotrichaceae bacterium]|nr:phospho-N-acetylmuramoyl-pentapeptide-transferase [Erysipelotrichaceae bacterium]